MKETSLPFGMLFQEVAQQAVLDSTTHTPHYDPNEGLSFMVNKDGKSVPYVKWNKHNLATITGINTKANDDPTDRD